MPCVGCGKECKCTPEKCSDSCKCQSPGKCGCNPSNAASSSSGGCCKKAGDTAGGDAKGKCCGDTKK
ncbi:metallothionein-3 [Drosophila elegans]|uniref:metallothionein-3 n=1 Tax=Drosophila elegans TaxID=30023 RepID=UPI0007E5C7AD|nr:metallothionein-3 [Drosophila elegans]